MKKLGFGLMRLPLIDEEDKGSIDLLRFGKMVDHFMKEGFSHFDTAYMYHQSKSEEAFRKMVVEKYPREDFTVTDKMPIYLVEKEEDLGRIFEEQLQRCGVEYFDYYWIHALNQERYRICENVGAFAFLSRLKEEGKIRHIGFSFHDSAEVLDGILEKEKEVEFVQLQINYLDWEDPVIQSRRCYETVRKHGRKIFVMEPIKGGTLANLPKKAEALLKEMDPKASAASWALRYAASLEDVVMVLSGMSDEAQLYENTELFSPLEALGEKEFDLLGRVVKHIKESLKVACTACRYCVDDCPKQIAIPDYFALYNEYIEHGDPDDPGLREGFEKLARKYGKPGDCISCKQCEALCPQILPISDTMEKLSKVFEKK